MWNKCIIHQYDSSGIYVLNIHFKYKKNQRFSDGNWSKTDKTSGKYCTTEPQLCFNGNNWFNDSGRFLSTGESTGIMYS